MSSFKLTLPIGTGSNNYPAKEIKRPELETYSHPHFFTLNAAKDAVVFMNTAGDCDLYFEDDEVWARTSSGTNYARSELRELYDNGNSGDGIDEWDLLEGTHEMVIRQSIEELTFVQKKHAVVGQIHWESGSDLIMIRYEDYAGQKRLFVENNGRDHGWTLDPNYQIGDIFTVSIKVENASIIISYDNEVTNVSEVITMPSSMVMDQIESDSDNSLVYYKAGMYGQSSLLKIASEEPCSYAKTYMYSLSVTHN